MAKTIKIPFQERLFASEQPRSDVQVTQDETGLTVTGLPEDHDLYFVLRSRAGEYLLGHKQDYEHFLNMRLHVGSEGELREARVGHAITDPGKVDLYYDFEGHEGRLTIWESWCRVEYKLQRRDLEKMVSKKIENHTIVS
jgi:hypothetical protein